MKEQILTELTINSEDTREMRDQLMHVHTWNGDSIETTFRLKREGQGKIRFGYEGGFEQAVVEVDFTSGRVSFNSTDWTCDQPVAVETFESKSRKEHRLLIKKSAGSGILVKMANIDVFLDENLILSVPDANILPETGVFLKGKEVYIKKCIHRGTPSGIPEYLNVGGWQMLDRPSISENLESIFRGLRQAAGKGVQLLVTTETSLTGNYPTHDVTQDRVAIAEAEYKLRKFIGKLPDAPYVIVGLPAWKEIENHKRKESRFSVCRVYNPDGEIVTERAKIHSCEPNFCSGYELHEVDICGVPCSLHICHDGRYPEVWTLPVMFGTRLVIHPANGGSRLISSIDAFESAARRSTMTSHAFYMNVNGWSGSMIAGPRTNKSSSNLMATSLECRRDSSSFPMVGDPQECLVDANIRIHDAFGYWPTRSFRGSEDIAAGYLKLYQAMGGTRQPG